MTKKSNNLATDGRVGPTYQGPAETPFCSTSSTFGTSVTVSGTAQYVRRNPWGNASVGGLGSASTSGTHPATINPIRQAEVRVTDPAGNVVQCATTSDTGSFSFTLPKGDTTYTVSVNSRANNGLLYASVLNQPEKNQFYSLSTTVNASASTNLGTTLTATADGELLGAAFNILDQIYNANRYLRTQVSSCSTDFTGCRNVINSTTVISSSNSSGRVPKVTAYWMKGFNPNSYFGGSGGLSFYLPDYSRLFILGGQNGNVDSSDTDHFDDSVILHEYGHFLEDVIGESDSPGGQHTGTKPIDPRLAWSEGWGNFFQAAVRNSPYYIDTLGNDDGTTDMAFYVDLETVNSSAGYDYPTQTGEGNFREFSITRLLWDAVDTPQDNGGFGGANEAISGAFDEIWAAFTSTTKGFAYAGYAFRNIGLLHLIQRDYNKRDWTDVRAANRHDGDTSQYGQALTTSCGTAPFPGGYYFSITPVSATGDDGSFSRSDLLNNNDFFHYRATSSGAGNITLKYSQNGSGQKPDLDLYIYKEDHVFGASSGWAGYSRLNPTATDPQVEPAKITFTANANYLLNVFVYTGNGPGVPAYYNLLLNGVTPLCRLNTVPY